MGHLTEEKVYKEKKELSMLSYMIDADKIWSGDHVYVYFFN